jgi:hypothetical protein
MVNLPIELREQSAEDRAAVLRTLDLLRPIVAAGCPVYAWDGMETGKGDVVLSHSHFVVRDADWMRHVRAQRT